MNLAQLIKPELLQLIQNIGTKNMYSGNKIPGSVMKMFTIDERTDGAGILVPYWISVLQTGRGPRKGSKYMGFDKRIFKWMSKNGMFKSSTLKGKKNEARFMTWYINKYGNKQFRNKVFVDIYETERRKTIAKINAKIGTELHRITMEII